MAKSTAIANAVKASEFHRRCRATLETAAGVYSAMSGFGKARRFVDISWLKDNNSVDAANLPDPEILAAEAASELTEALRELDGLLNALGAGDEAESQKKLLAEVLGMGDG